MVKTIAKLLTVVTILFMVVACSAADIEQLVQPPRAATQTALAELEKAIPAGTSTPVPAPIVAKPSTEIELKTPVAKVNRPITVWLNQTEERYQIQLRSWAEAFSAETGYQVEFIYLDTQKILDLARSAEITQQLPDIIFHQIEYSAGLVDLGILDPAAATAAINGLDPSTFAAGALDMIPATDGQYTAIPSDGWQHLLIYRQDWFTAAGINPPTNFNDLLVGADTFYAVPTEIISSTNAADVITGIVVPTESDLISTQQTFEHIAIANGCDLVDEKGEVLLLNPNCLAALDFYRDLVYDYSPPGFQTEISALKAYLAGRTAMIITSPDVLPMLAGTNPQFAPTCTECAADPDYLAKNTGYITSLRGNSTNAQAANFSVVNYLGITQGADSEAAQIFVDYWFNSGYQSWLAIAPERHLPMRVNDDVLDEWRTHALSGNDSSISAAFSPAVTELLIADLTTSERWGYEQGQGQLVTDVYDELAIAPIIQKMLSGYSSSSQAIIEMNQAVIGKIDNYEFFPSE